MIEKQPTQPPTPEQDKERKNQQEEIDTGITRRGFLKLMAIHAGMYAVGYHIGKEIKMFQEEENTPDTWTDAPQEVEDQFWLSIIEHVSRKDGQDLIPQDVRAYLITKLFNIPQGWTSGIATEKVVQPDGTVEQKRTAPELDKLVATYFTNKTVTVGETDDGQPIISTDFRDFPDIEQTLASFKEQVSQLPPDRGGALGMEISSILEKEYAHLTKIDNPDNTDTQRDCPVEFDYLPGGVPLFLRGYTHAKDWQNVHGKHLAETYKNAAYIAIESSGVPLGDRLKSYWSNPHEQIGDYDVLMKDLVDHGFNGMFMDVDARDITKILFDSYSDKEGILRTIELPHIYYDHYFHYLEKENPRFAQKIQTPERLKQLLFAQSTAAKASEIGRVTSDKKWYDASLSIDHKFESISLPTGYELGQMAFADAMAALKLHILAQKMNEGTVKKGIIVDFEGAEHLFMKSFYLKYPQYAAEIVLRTINEALAGEMDGSLPYERYRSGKNNPENLAQAIDILNKPEWLNVVVQISRIPMAYVENDPHKTTAIGPNQKQMIRNDELNTGFDVLQDLTIVRALYDDKYIQSHIDRVRAKNTK